MLIAFRQKQLSYVNQLCSISQAMMLKYLLSFLCVFSLWPGIATVPTMPPNPQNTDIDILIRRYCAKCFFKLKQSLDFVYTFWSIFGTDINTIPTTQESTESEKGEIIGFRSGYFSFSKLREKYNFLFSALDQIIICIINFKCKVT